MKATTIKVEGDLLEELASARPSRHGRPVAFVRSLLKQAVADDAWSRRPTVAEFVRGTPEERTWLAEWGSADLSHGARRRRR
jgi:hypothetical protein